MTGGAEEFFTIGGPFKVVVDLSQMRDWREVLAEDAAGVPRRGMFVPYLQNGIRRYCTPGAPGARVRPLMTLMALPPNTPQGVERAMAYGELRQVLQYIPGGNWEEMLRQGLAAPGDMRRGRFVGHVYRLSGPLREGGA